MDVKEEILRFQHIQVNRYLSSRPQKRFSGRCEFDAVMGMITDAWVELCYSSQWKCLSRQGRDTLYWGTTIVFPGFVADNPNSYVPFDFVNDLRIGLPCLNFESSTHDMGYYDSISEPCS